ncbi:hypothetical protein [Microbaculum marinum]|uniref:Secreted protein n=1 Tax=Microbaculum marinum TaxID=1764581 RepID=A0AAW9RPL1_9HYPH
MSDRRTPRPFVLAAVTAALLGGGLTLTMALAPVPTDAATGPAAGASGSCAESIAQVHRGFGASLTRLADVAEAGPAERCVAYRTHLAAIDTARVVYGSCMTGFARDDQVGQLDLAYSDWRTTIDDRCSE